MINYYLALSQGISHTRNRNMLHGYYRENICIVFFILVSSFEFIGNLNVELTVKLCFRYWLYLWILKYVRVVWFFISNPKILYVWVLLIFLSLHAVYFWTNVCFNLEHSSISPLNCWNIIKIYALWNIVQSFSANNFFVACMIWNFEVCTFCSIGFL